MNTQGYEGNIHRTAAVYTNDPKMSRFTLGIKAFVLVPISVKPNYVRLYGTEGATITNRVEITAGLDKPLTLEPDRFNLEGKVNYRIEEIEKGKKFIIYFTNIIGEEDSYSGFLNLKTNYDESPTVNIKIIVRLKKQ